MIGDHSGERTLFQVSDWFSDIGKTPTHPKLQWGSKSEISNTIIVSVYLCITSVSATVKVPRRAQNCVFWQNTHPGGACMYLILVLVLLLPLYLSSLPFNHPPPPSLPWFSTLRPFSSASLFSPLLKSSPEERLDLPSYARSPPRPEHPTHWDPTSTRIRFLIPRLFCHSFNSASNRYLFENTSYTRRTQESHKVALIDRVACHFGM